MFGNSGDGRGKRDYDREFERGGFDRRTSGEQNRYDNQGYGNRGYGTGQHAGDARDMEARSALYLAKVMGWMCVGLLTTVVAAMAALYVPAVAIFVFSSPVVYFGIIIAQFAMVIALSAVKQRMSPGTATVMIMVYAELTDDKMSEII